MSPGDQRLFYLKYQIGFSEEDFQLWESIGQQKHVKDPFTRMAKEKFGLSENYAKKRISQIKADIIAKMNQSGHTQASYKQDTSVTTSRLQTSVEKRIFVRTTHVTQAQTMTLHPTSHPQIVFAGGRLFTPECYAAFDGLLVFTGGITGLQGLAAEAVGDGRIPCPYRIHGVETPVRVIKTEELPGVIHEDLDQLAAQGCRKIAIHAPNSVDGSRIAIEAAKDWLQLHPDGADTLYFVDARDDYFHVFGSEI